MGAHFTDEEAEAQGGKEAKKGVLTPRNTGGETEHILLEKSQAAGGRYVIKMQPQV